jgi:hypothetical protein
LGGGARSLGATALKYLDIRILVCRGSSVLVLKNTIGPTTRTWREGEVDVEDMRYI